MSKSGELIVLIGLPGSGKTEYAKQWINHAAEGLGRKVYRVSWDELRKELGHTGAFDHRREEEMKNRQCRTRKFAIEHRGVHGHHHRQYEPFGLHAQHVARRSAAILVSIMPSTRWLIDVRIAVQRDEYRTGDAQVGRAVIERMALFAGKIHFHPGFDLGYKNIVLVDVDGTLADNTHRAHIVAPQKCVVCDGFGTMPIMHGFMQTRGQEVHLVPRYRAAQEELV